MTATTSSPRTRRWMLSLALLVGVAASSGVTTHAQAKPKKTQLVTVSLTAIVETVDDSFGILCSDVAVGDVITASYTYNPLTSDSNALDYVGDYEHTAAPAGLQVDLGGAVAATDPANVLFLLELVNDFPGDGSDNYLLRSYNNLPMECGSPVGHVAWQLDDPTGTALTSTALTAAPRISQPSAPSLV